MFLLNGSSNTPSQRIHLNGSFDNTASGTTDANSAVNGVNGRNGRMNAAHVAWFGTAAQVIMCLGIHLAAQV